MTAMPAASLVVSGGIAALSVLVAALFIAGVSCTGDAAGRARRALIAVALTSLWMGGAYLVAGTGSLARFDRDPPPFVLLLLAVLALAGGLGLSSLGERLARRLPLAALVLAQGFRLPLELVMHRAADEGVMPRQMSFDGYNFDILTGATALLLGAALALRLRVPRALVLAWNVGGSLLLCNIVTVAVLSTPRLHRFGTDPGQLNTWVFYPPFVWLPTVLVAAALLGHVLIFRALRGRGDGRP